VTASAANADLARLYAETRARVLTVVTGLREAGTAAPVPACPGWSVRDVLAHLAAIAEDGRAGLLTGPPDDAQTAAQVARFGGRGLPGILAAWAAAAPGFGEVIASARVWPAVIDVTSHEHDIRGALGRPGARDSEAVTVCANRLLGWLRPAVPLRVIVEDGEFQLGPEHTGPRPCLTLATTRFEAFRWRMGRRSRAQLMALDWSGDPSPVLGQLTVFGPATADVIE
jgi:uncharacterized protein (TIGR03083 family)